jgi:hypothetical protein
MVVSASVPRGLRELRGADRRGRDADTDARFLRRITMTARPVGDQEDQLHQHQPRETGAATYLDCARVDWGKHGCGHPIAGGSWILVRDGGGSVGTVSHRHSDSGRRSGRQSIDISKVSDRAILTIQRIVRVSPAPRFVSSVSWHRASPQALTPRSCRPKHDIDDAKESAWGSRRSSPARR